jgi:hypothetical protein
MWMEIKGKIILPNVHNGFGLGEGGDFHHKC